ncbi:MAG: NUDIX hydrolase [Burkholderiaceae bacterium]|nr:NUDIX hydrolase [Burkholderiaceae bacterium]
MGPEDPRPKRLPNEPYPALAEDRLSGESVYEGRLLHVHRDWVRAPDGHEHALEYTLHPGAAAVIPILDDGRLVMERQWRYAMNRSFLEFPAGKLNAGEHPLECIRRELIEETGYRAREWARLGEMHPVIAYSTEVIHLYAARGLEAGESMQEDGECLEIVTVTVDEFFNAVYRGEITDSKTLACGLWLDRLRRQEWSVTWISV